jgi:uncharacterized protein (DUF952 family)
MDNWPEFIYHIITPDKWSEAQAVGKYTAPSLLSEGFIHFSYLDQISGTAERYYSQIPGLLVLKVEVARLTAELKVEQAAHGGWYPHLYGALNLSAVVGYHPLRRTDKGVWELLPLIGWSLPC